MLKFYSEKDVKRLTLRIKEEYEKALVVQRDEIKNLREKNRVLSARVSELECERGEVTSTLLRAKKEGAKLREEEALALQQERKELALLLEKYRNLLDEVAKKYPEVQEDCAYEAFLAELKGEGETAFNIDEVLSPKTPLDLGKLCAELGLMEEQE